MMGDITIKIGNKKVRVKVLDREKCGNYECFVPHDCPVQGAGGVRASEPRWMCLTNYESWSYRVKINRNFVKCLYRQYLE